MNKCTPLVMEAFLLPVISIIHLLSIMGVGWPLGNCIAVEMNMNERRRMFSVV